jgi:hypothetical protein
MPDHVSYNLLLKKEMQNFKRKKTLIHPTYDQNWTLKFNLNAQI